MFLFFAFAGTQVANSSATSAGSESTQLPQGPNPIILLYISLAFAFSLTVNAWIFFRVSGGLFNPAVGATSFLRKQPVFLVSSNSGLSENFNADMPLTGDARLVSCWRRTILPWCFCLHRTNARRHG